MKKTLLRALFLISSILVLTAMTASADLAYIDYYGFATETNGIPNSLPGDELSFKCITDFLTPEFEVDLAEVELTFHVYGLISGGEIPFTGDIMMINYAGGYLEAYVDPSMNADWAEVMPTSVGPSTFSDGDLFFRGEFTDFVLMLNPLTGEGLFEGNLNGIEGNAVDGFCEGCAYTWGGAFTAAAEAQIPPGYDIQMDGQFEINATVRTNSSTWGQLKSLYR